MAVLALEPADDVLRDHLFDVASEAALLLDGDAQVVSASPAARRLFGSRLERWPFIFPAAGDGGAAVLAAFLVELCASGSASVELPLGPRQLALRGRTLGDRYAVVVRDVSELRAIEDELARLRRVESLGLLAASMAHDVHNLMASALAVTSQLAHATAGLPGAAMADELQSLAERAQALARGMLDVVRDRPPVLELVDVSQVVRALAPTLSRVLGERVELAFSFEQGAEVRVDRERLEQALLNLADNARHAMPQGGTVTIAAASTPSPPSSGDGSSSQTVVVTVTDDGVGMSSEIRARSQDAFYSTRPASEGTGIGLTSVRRFALDSQGTLEVESEPGKGTTVTLRLPRASRSERITIPAAPHRSPAERERNGEPTKDAS